jgi:hypothetical protein
MNSDFNKDMLIQHTKQKVIHNSRVITFLTIVCLILGLFVSVVNNFTLKIDLYELVFIIVPLMIYAFYNFFYNNWIFRFYGATCPAMTEPLNRTE